MDITDAWLYKYIQIVDEAIIAEVEKKIDQDYVFSEQFKKKMDKTIRSEKLIQLLNKLGKRVAIFAFIVVGSLITVTMSIKAYRIHFFETVKTICEDSFFYTYFTGGNEIEFQEYKLEYLPNGYRLIEELSNNNTSTRIYSNESGEQIVIDQHLASDKRTIFFDLEYSTKNEVNVKGVPLLIYRYTDGFVSAYYEYKNSVFILSADRLSDNEIIQIIENID